MKHWITAATLLAAALAAQAQAHEGEVRKLDKAQGKLTLQHGEIKALEMPPMTMVYRVANPALLDHPDVTSEDAADLCVGGFVGLMTALPVAAILIVLASRLPELAAVICVWSPESAMLRARTSSADGDAVAAADVRASFCTESWPPPRSVRSPCAATVISPALPLASDWPRTR